VYYARLLCCWLEEGGGKLEHTAITTDLAAMRRMESCEVGRAKRACAALARIGCLVEIRWCPAHCGIKGKEVAD